MFDDFDWPDGPDAAEWEAETESLERAAQLSAERDEGLSEVNIPALTALARRVSSLNSKAGEIGPGMLAQLIALAERALRT